MKTTQHSSDNMHLFCPTLIITMSASFCPRPMMSTIFHFCKKKSKKIVSLCYAASYQPFPVLESLMKLINSCSNNSVEIITVQLHVQNQCDDDRVCHVLFDAPISGTILHVCKNFMPNHKILTMNNRQCMFRPYGFPHVHPTQMGLNPETRSARKESLTNFL